MEIIIFLLIVVAVSWGFASEHGDRWQGHSVAAFSATYAGAGSSGLS